MSIDFSDMLGDSDEVVIAPRDIFFTLNRSSSFSFPRDIQTEVMNQWFSCRDNRDNVIKLNVGSGKTLVGLLLLQSSLNEGKGPALYVCPDKQLSQQIVDEANALGIDITDDPHDPAYAAGERICVINIYKLFNGKSIFGVGSSKINIGAIVIDDAHACVSTIAKQFRIRLTNTHVAYQKILSIVSEDLKGYNAARYMDIESSDPYTFMEVPFWSWDSHQNEILKALHDSRNDEELQFTYLLLRDILKQCRCVIGGQHLEIEPYFPATDLIQSFRRAKRRIYMTATMSDDSVLVTHFGASASALENPIVPSSSQSMGERMILMPQELNPDITLINLRDLLVDLAKTVNVVVIVPSENAITDWLSHAQQVLIGDNVVTGIEKLRNSHVGLTVLVNRYDGIDLPGDACRILAIVDLPEVNSYVDQIDSEVLSGTAVNLRRQIERIEQGMGRGVRSNEDYCTVLLLGSKLTTRLRSPDGHQMLTPATKAQLNLSREIAKKLDQPSIDEIKSVIEQCLNRDPGWIKVSKKVLVSLKADDQLRLDPSKLALKAAYDEARANQYSNAVNKIDTAIDLTEDNHIRAWLLSWKAVFQHTIDAEGAQKTLAAAHKMEPSVTKPLHGTTYKTLTPATGKQATSLIENHEKRFIDATMMKLFADGLCSDLQFKPDTSETFEAAINDLAVFIGIKSQRPEKNYNDGPDNLWALYDGSFLVIECKNGVTSDSGIAKKDAGQLDQSMDWFRGKYFASNAIPVLIHPQRFLGQGASSVENMRIIDDKGLEKLRNNLRKFAKQLVEPDVMASTSKIATLLAQYELSADAFVNGYSVPVKS